MSDPCARLIQDRKDMPMWIRDTVVRRHRWHGYATFQRATCSECGRVGMVARGVDWKQMDEQSCYYCLQQCQTPVVR